MPTVKIGIKPAKSKAVTKKAVSSKVTAKTGNAESLNSLTVQIYDSEGKKAGTQKLPGASFSAKSNDQLLSQAVRVYETNLSSHNANTKTRSEVRGGGAKPWRQKGTGNARAGSKRSPLWVGGGITFGPRARNVKLTLPAKMKQKALIIALSQKSKLNNIRVVSDLEKLQPKTKIIANLIKTLNLKGPTLLIVSAKNRNVNLASRNVQNVKVDLVTNLNAYQVIKTANLIFSKEAISAFK